MTLLFTLLILFSFIAKIASQTAWNGEYTDPVWGGSMYLCVSQVNGVNYVNGVFSEIGYIRGTVTDNFTITNANWYMQGYEGRHGTVTLTLTTSTTPATYTASWLDDGGNGYSYTSSGSQTGTDMPDPLQCFQPDDSCLPSCSFEMAGIYEATTGDGNTYWNNNDDQGNYVASYQYTWGAGNIANGYQYGPIMDQTAQIGVGDWYESGNTVGVEMWVAKNATSYYYMWWWIPRISDYDFNGGQSHGNSIKTRYSLDTSDYNEWKCYIYPQSSDEDDCFQNTGTGGCPDVVANDDNNFVQRPVGMAILVFAILNFAAILICAGIFYKSTSIPMGMSSSSDTKGVEMNA